MNSYDKQFNANDTLQSIQTTALDDYINRVFKIVLILVPGACLSASIIFGVLKIMGYVPKSVNTTALLIFIGTTISYLIYSIYLIRTGFENGITKPRKLKTAKHFIMVVEFIQWNFITYLIPATDFWGFAFFFVILTSFFLDRKLTTFVSVEIGVSAIISWFIKGDIILPEKNNLFVLNMTLRAIGLVFSLFTIDFLVYLVSKFLVRAKSDELQRNNDQLVSVLSAAHELSDNLIKSGNLLGDISSNQAMTAEELSTTSNELLTQSNSLREKSHDSIENLNDLKSTGANLSDNVRKVGENSDEVNKMSADNEKFLDSLQKVNSELIDSMKETDAVAGRLSSSVDGITKTLKLLNDLAKQTNILSINATIEAARAGEAGKTFSVVAREVGNLADWTQKSLSEIKEILDNVSYCVETVTKSVEENNNKLELQNGYFTKVFTNMREMNALLVQTAEDISAMNYVHMRQAQIITHTVDINSDIADSIESENQAFGAISYVVENNTKDAIRVKEQVDNIINMANKLDDLLNM